MFVYFDSFSCRWTEEGKFGLILSSHNQFTGLKWCDLQIKVSMYSCEQVCLFSIAYLLVARDSQCSKNT